MEKAMENTEKHVKSDVILSVKERFCFATGDFAYQCVFYWVSAYLMIFYTDVFLIPAAAVSVLMLVVRLYDAVNDPIHRLIDGQDQYPSGEIPALDHCGRHRSDPFGPGHVLGASIME